MIALIRAVYGSLEPVARLSRSVDDRCSVGNGGVGGVGVGLITAGSVDRQVDGWNGSPPILSVCSLGGARLGARVITGKINDWDRRDCGLTLISICYSVLRSFVDSKPRPYFASPRIPRF